MTISGTPSRAISTAWAWRRWCGAKHRRTPALRATCRSSERAAAAARAVRAWAVDDAEQRPDGQLDQRPQPRRELPPGPVVHADLAAAAALAAPHQQRTAPPIELGLGECERLVNAKAGAPQHDD
jgi:hypothetical protein